MHFICDLTDSKRLHGRKLQLNDCYCSVNDDEASGDFNDVLLSNNKRITFRSQIAAAYDVCGEYNYTAFIKSYILQTSVHCTVLFCLNRSR